MVCREVHRIAYFFLDGALAKQKQHDIQQHLDDCKDCDDRFKVHQRLRNFVRRRLQRMSAPDGLRSRIANLLRGPGPQTSA